MDLRGYTQGKNFWEVFKHLEPMFSSFIKKKGRDKSSKIMWGVAYAYHPSSEYWELPEKLRQKTSADYILQNSKFNWESISEEVKMFQQMTLSTAERFFSAWKKKIEQREEFFLTAEYTGDPDVDEYNDKMLARSEDLWKRYSRCLKSVKDQNELKGRAQGGGEESLVDSGAI